MSARKPEGTIRISGPTQCGKTLVAAVVERVLRQAFGATVIAEDLEAARRLGNPDFPKEWERQMVAETLWRIEEVNMPRGGQ